MNIFVSFFNKSGGFEGRRWLLLLALFGCSACGEIYFPTGPEPTGRPMVTIVEPPIGASRVAAFGQPVTTRVITSQPYKTIQGEVKYPSGTWAAGNSSPVAAPGMYFWSSYGVTFVAAQSGVYSHEYMAFNEYGFDLANGLFTIILHHDLAPDKDPLETCKEDECEDTIPPPSGIPTVTYDPEVLTPDPYVSEKVAADITEAEVHEIVSQASPEFLEYTAEQYGGVVEDWLIENGYLTASLEVQLGFSERIDRYIAIIEQMDQDVMAGFSSNETVVRLLSRMQAIYQTSGSAAPGKSPGKSSRRGGG